ncbi:2-phosphosulfolactate phosphatase [Nostoc sp. FACHB-152]|uniref:2-phosphosulfolactate phosphatase n=1 Tax=unclassified Nostoc TaxID=2593658 RepID=UPI0016896A30|nr:MULTISPECIES: 2-phosphosulfolactate phosphatase [unclassified Nostoc]MBD2451485.1 2-phosphosulfolactate phosphatase [Nostoc sp. FACHB-152]MBD2472988.1 2-phosphosulfolactate phosphatase [Nostoc sp. FACHB-145]
MNKLFSQGHACIVGVGGDLPNTVDDAVGFAGCLRNSEAVARFAQSYGSKIAVIPAGERWKEDGSLRPAFEDLVGAGAILSYLDGSLSPEAAIALQSFQAFRQDLLGHLQKCSSGKELITKDFASDVELAAAFNVSSCVLLFTDNAYRKQSV